MSKLSKFLKSNGLNALANAAIGNPVGAVTSLFGITGENTEEGILKALESKSELINKIKEKENEYVNIILKDRESAREMMVAVNSSVNSSWLSKNITAIIAISWVTFCMYLYWVSLVGGTGEDQQMNSTVVSSITNITMLIVGFYFGSSEKK